MSEGNKALIRRYIDEVWNKGDLTVVDELYASNFVDRRDSLPPGISADREGLKRLISVYLSGMPDAHFIIEDQVAEGDKVVTRWRATGTQSGELLGIPPTGKQVDVTGIWIDRIKGGKVVEEWGVSDQLGMMQQLGVVPAPGPSGG